MAPRRFWGVLWQVVSISSITRSLFDMKISNKIEKKISITHMVRCRSNQLSLSVQLVGETLIAQSSLSERHTVGWACSEPVPKWRP